MKKEMPFWILRIALSATFIIIGIMILQEPLTWGSYLSPWATKLLPTPLEQAMVGTGILDILVGTLLLINPLVWLGALLGSAHLVIVLVGSDINAFGITVRDIGLLGATLHIFLKTFPKEMLNRKQ